MKRSEHDALELLKEQIKWQAEEQRRFNAMAQHRNIGCDSSCADGADCTCSHSQAWRAPRQPRKPEPRRPHLPLWTRFKLWAQQHHVDILLCVCAAGVFTLCAVMGAALGLFR